MKKLLILIAVILLIILMVAVGAILVVRTLPALLLNTRTEEGLPETIAVEEPPTALEAYALVAPIAAQWSPDAYLFRVSALPQSLTDRPTKGPCIGTDGRIAEHGVWLLQFMSAAQDRQLMVKVTALGELTTESTALVGPASSYTALEPGWCDSSTAMAIAEKETGAAYRSDWGPMLDVLIELDGYRQTWWVHYMPADPNGGRLHVYVDPVSQEVIDVVRQ